MAVERWRTTRLGAEADLRTGFPFKSSHYADGSNSIRLLRGDNIVQGRLRWDGAKRWPVALTREFEEYFLQVDDVVLAMDRPWIEAGLKYGSISEHDLPCLLVQRVARLRGRQDLDTRFLKYLVGSRAFTDYIVAVQTGTAVPHISGEQIRDFEFECPPPSEQRAIVGILGTLDKKIELNRRTNETLEAMARATFKSWFVDFDPVRAKRNGAAAAVGCPKSVFDLFPRRFLASEIGPIPEGWRVVSWGDVATLEYGRALRDYDEKMGRYRVYGTNGPIGWSDKYLCPHAGVVIGRKGAYRGVHFSSAPFYVIDTAFYVEPKLELDWRWAYYTLLRIGINEMDSGSAIPSTSREDFYRVPVCVPQAPIMESYGSIVRQLFVKIEQDERMSASLAAIRDTLLPKLLSGGMRVKDAEKLVGTAT
jgi:type I restriction enzyme S subunit